MELRETKRAERAAHPPRQLKPAQKAGDLREASFTDKLGEKLSIILLILIVAVLLTLLLRRFGVLDPSRLQAFVVSTGHWGPAVIIGLITWGTVSLSLPATPAILIAGVLYGPLLGSLYAFIGVLLGASIAFFIARYFRHYIIGWLGPHAELLLRFQQKYVAWLVFFTRAIPVFSFEVISYAAGLTGISYGRYILATAAGIVPLLFVYTTSAGYLLETSGEFFPIVMALFMICAVFVIPLAIDHYNPWGWKEKLLNQKKPLKRR